MLGDNTMTTKTYTINSTDIYGCNDLDNFGEAVIVQIENSACSVTVLEGITVQFSITAKKDGESRDFVVAFQSADRTDSLEAYNGYEMTRASHFGYDTDESSELSGWLDDDSVVNELQKLAEQHSKAILEEMANS